jgi:diguanylate cyclase (GGDEF)-like protein/PAS domain S-box-containing protein
MAWIHWIALITAVTVLAGCFWGRRRMLAAWKRDREQLHTSEQRYRLLFDESPKPMYAFDLETLKFVNVNEAALRHYGYTRQEFLALTADKIRPESEIRLMMERMYGEVQTPCATRHRKKDGTLIDVEVSVQHLSNENTPMVLVSVNDITEQKRAEENLKLAHQSLAQSVCELQKRETHLRQLATMGEMLQACHTSDEAYSMVSNSLREIFPNYSGCVYALKTSRDLVESVAEWGDRRVNGALFYPDDCWALRRGRPHVVKWGRGTRCKHLASNLLSSLCVPMMAQSDAMGVLHLVPDFVDELAEEPLISASLETLAKTAADQIALALSNIRFREALQNQSIRDPLTTLYNRRYMEESLERELHRAQRGETSVAVIMIDVDHFKRFNDSYGHRAADKMLCLFASFLQGSVRVEDIVCRYGGEEFVMILPSSSLNEAIKRSQQLQEGTRRLHVETDGGPAENVTISVGIAMFPEHGCEPETLLAVADRALYHAKKAGRDRLVVGAAVPVR